MRKTLLQELWRLIPAAEGCVACGGCCGPVFFTEAESKIIQRFCASEGIEIPETAEGINCSMLKDGKCVIYRVRPMMCRLHGVTPKLHCSRTKKEHFAMNHRAVFLIGEYHKYVRASSQHFTFGFTFEQVKNFGVKNNAKASNIAACAAR